MFECFVAHQGFFWGLTGLLLISEALGETQAVKANGVLSFTVEALEQISRLIRKTLFSK